MATDFRAERGRFFEIVGSGSSGSMGPGLAIFSASSANPSYLPGYTDNNIFAGVGKDVFLFVSGNTSKKGIVGGGATLFGGDVIVSGTLYAEKQVIEVDESVTGSLSVSGSLMVSQSAEIHGWNGTIGPANTGPYIGLHFTNQPSPQAIAWDGLDGVVDAAVWEAYDDLHLSASKQVVILSSSKGSAGATSLDNRNFADTNFFVSGTIGSRGTLVRGTSVFGGDVHVSGNVNIGGGSLTGGPWTDEGSLLRPTDGGGVENIGVGAAGTSLGMYPAAIHGTTGDIVSNRFVTASMGFSGSLTRLTDGRSYLVQGSNVTITSTSNGQVVINSTGGGSSEWSRGAGSVWPNTEATTSVLVGSTGAGTADHVLYADGRATFNQQNNNSDFIVHTSGEPAALSINGTLNRLTINEGESAFVTSIRNVNDTAIDIGPAGVIFNQDGHATNDFRVESNASQGALIVDAGSNVVMMGTNSTSITGEAVPVGADVRLYMSGTSGSMGTTSKGTALISGDLLISGTVVLGGKRQASPIDGYALEVSGSSRAGGGYGGRLEYIYGSFSYDMTNPRPRFLPLAKSHEDLNFLTGDSGSLGAAITFPHNGVLKGVRLSLSGASGNTNNPGNTQMSFYTSTGLTANVNLIKQVGPILTFASAPSGFVSALSPIVAIGNDDGQTWFFDFENKIINKDRLMLLAFGCTTGPNTGTRYHGSYTVIFEYNEFT